MEPSLPQACNVGVRECGGGGNYGPLPREERNEVDVLIGIIQTPKEIEVEMTDEVDREELLAQIEKSLDSGDGVLWLTDRRGRRVAVPVVKVAYIEVGVPAHERRVGFGAP